MSTNVLVVGSGAREHALAWKLRQSPRVGELLVAPGNPGTAKIAENLPLGVLDFEGVTKAIRGRRVGLVVVGPEGPLAEGLVDRLLRLDVAVFGPTRAAAMIESSKSFAKRLMAEACIPTAYSATFDDYDAAVAYVNGAEKPPVVKADGLAAGKGVTVAADAEEALAAIRSAMIENAFGQAGQRVVLEERLHGREVSVHAFCDGQAALPMPYACDHKAVRDGGLGPNTGGMGAYSPPGFVDESLDAAIWQQIVNPVVQTLADWGAPYRGALYPGLMITEAGPRVIEFNCRFGDPETEVLLPRLVSDLFEPLWGAATGSLAETRLSWADEACVAVVLAADGYPGQARQGDIIEGLDDVDSDILVFQAGTAEDSVGRVLTAGGRVLTVVGTGATLEDARARVYENLPRIHFVGCHFRSDIGLARV